MSEPVSSAIYQIEIGLDAANDANHEFDVWKRVQRAASNFDEAPQDQTRVGELALERAKRLVENGTDVVIVLDSITRMARAYNLALPTSGRTLTGGFDPVALYPAKKFFGAARKIENGGSLTIIGTSLVDTGSRMDDLIQYLRGKRWGTLFDIRMF